MSMEVHLLNLSKLTRLEDQLTNLLEKIDQEIIQTDIEWLHVKSIVEEQNKSTTDSPSVTEEPDIKPRVKNNEICNIKMEFEEVEHYPLELKLEPHRFDMEDEEFDSD